MTQMLCIVMTTSVRLRICLGSGIFSLVGNSSLPTPAHRPGDSAGSSSEAPDMARNISAVARLTMGVALLAYGASPAAAHEFWIAPKSGVVTPGDTIVGDLMVGVMLRGNPYPYLPQYVVRFEVTAKGRTESVVGLPGDIPALSHTVHRAGLQVIVHQTVPFRATYDDWQLFRQYVVDEGFPEVEALHLKRGLPITGFSERYTRYVKALVQAGPPQSGDSDLRTGLPFELVAESNPYQAGLNSLAVRLYWRDEPAPDVQISILRDTGTVERRTVRTDKEGRARIALQAGRYLLSAVRIDPVENEPVVWFSHWAALSFIIGK